MGKGSIDDFQNEREQLNELVMKYSDRGTKRFYALDAPLYDDGALPKKTKELLGLVTSLVLRCDDCVMYHLIQCHKEGISDEELQEALAIAIFVGGSITIPHHRRAIKAWDELKGD